MKVGAHEDQVVDVGDGCLTSALGVEDVSKYIVCLKPIVLLDRNYVDCPGLLFPPADPTLFRIPDVYGNGSLAASRRLMLPGQFWQGLPIRRQVIMGEFPFSEVRGDRIGILNGRYPSQSVRIHYTLQGRNREREMRTMRISWKVEVPGTERDNIVAL